nr:MAG TPA_asm: hypothetical protein [Caudoviricetes sp.]
MTLAADGPFGPSCTVNSTFCPSSRVRKSLPSIAEKCTNTSLPPSSGEIKPKPFSALNPLTVPSMLIDIRSLYVKPVSNDS